MYKKVVYILGAGASADAGGPLMRDFFSQSHQDDEIIYPKHFDDNNRYEMVNAEYQEWKENNPNGTMEQFFDYIANASFLGTVSQEVERYLIWYLGSYVVYRLRRRRIKQYYMNFIELLKRRGYRSTIITFNYDLIFEKLLFNTYGEFNYCLGSFDNKYHEDWTKCSNKGIKILKLHGSVNWAFCEECGALYLNAKPTVQKQKRERCQRRDKGFLNPFIVPPSWNKNEYLQSISSLWQQARDELENADVIAIVGYSFPDADQYARTLLSLVNQQDIKLIIANRNQVVVKKIQKIINNPTLLSSGLGFEEFVWELPKLLRRA